MGTCINPRPPPSTFSKYVRSPTKNIEKDLNKSKMDNISFDKSFVRP